MAKVTSIVKDLSAMASADIDVDFGANPITGKSKDTLIKYLQDKYGKNHVCHVGNRNTYKIKSIIIALGKIYGIESKMMYAASKAANNNLTLDENIMNSDDVAAYFGSHPELRDVAERMIGLTSAYAVHAGGMVVSNVDLTKNVPMQRSTGGAIAAMWDKDEMAAMGYNKLDLLGSSTSSILHIAKEMAGLDPYKEVPFDDIDVFHHIVLPVKNQNVFQFESNIGKRAFTELKPMSIKELSNANAIVRFLGSEIGRATYEKYQDNITEYQTGDKDYWLAKLRDEVADDRHFEICAELLEPTYGVIIYQEQLSELVYRLSNGEKSLTDGNQFRKMLDKFRDKNGKLEEVRDSPESLEKWHKGFMEIMNTFITPYLGKDGLESEDKNTRDFLNFNLRKDGTLPVPTKGIVSWCIAFLAYSFNILHSMAYTVTAYTTMYLKHYHPLEFWCASLIADHDKFDSIKKYISAMQKESGLKLLPPDINKSDEHFKVEGDAIRFGLGSMKGLGKSAKEIVSAREGGFENIEDFLNKVNRRIVNKRVIQVLLDTNSFSEFGDVEEVFAQLEKPVKNLEFITDIQARVIQERTLIGCNISFLDPMLEKAQAYTPITELEDAETEIVALMVTKTIQKKARNGNDYYYHTAECLNSHETFNFFNWDMKQIPINKGYVVKLQRRGDFVSMAQPRRRRW